MTARCNRESGVGLADDVAEVPLVDAVELVRRGEVKILCDDVCVRAVLEPPLDFFHPRAVDNLAPLP